MLVQDRADLAPERCHPASEMPATRRRNPPPEPPGTMSESSPKRRGRFSERLAGRTPGSCDRLQQSVQIASKVPSRRAAAECIRCFRTSSMTSTELPPRRGPRNMARRKQGSRGEPLRAGLNLIITIDDRLRSSMIGIAIGAPPRWPARWRARLLRLRSTAGHPISEYSPPGASPALRSRPQAFRGPRVSQSPLDAPTLNWGPERLWPRRWNPIQTGRQSSSFFGISTGSGPRAAGSLAATGSACPALVELTTDDGPLTTDEGKLTTDEGELATENGLLTTDKLASFRKK